jgi:hypothetical protein
VPHHSQNSLAEAPNASFGKFRPNAQCPPDFINGLLGRAASMKAPRNPAFQPGFPRQDATAHHAPFQRTRQGSEGWNRPRGSRYPHLPRRLVWRAVANLGRRYFLGGRASLASATAQTGAPFLDNGAWTSATEANKLSSSSCDGALSLGVRRKAALTDYVGPRPRNRPDDVAGPGCLEPSAAPDAVLRRAQSALRCR